MERLLLRLVGWAVRHRRGVLAGCAVAVALCALGLPRLAQDNSPERFFVQDAAELERYRRFQMDFGRDRVVRLAAHGERLWTAEGLAWLARLETGARELPGVFGVGGLYHHHRRRLPGWPPADPAGFRAEVAADPLDRAAGWVVGPRAGRAGGASVLVALYNLPPERESRLLADLEALLADSPEGVETAMAGLPVLQRSFDREMLRVARGIFPLLIALAVVLLLAALGSPADVARLLLLVAAVQVATLGPMGHLGVPLDVVSVLLLPLVFVISLATGVHVLLRFRGLRRRGAGPEAVAETYREKAWPVLWTGITTAAGFASLTLAPVPAVRVLGAWTAVGIALLTLAAWTLFPALLAGSGGSRGGERYERALASFGRRAAAASTRHRRGVVVLFAALAVALAAGAPRLERDVRLLGYLPADHPVRSGVERLEAQGLGVVAAELVLSSPDPAAVPFADIRSIERLGVLSDRLREMPGVLGALSAGDVQASARRWGLAEDEETGHLLATLRTRDRRQARVVVLVPMASADELAPVVREASEAAQAVFPELAVRRTGRFLLVAHAQRVLLETVGWSLALTLLVVVAGFRVSLGDTRLTLAALAVNLWPVVLVLGLLAWLRVPLDSATLMIAAVVLALAVDDTFHTLGRFRGGADRSTAERVTDTLAATAPAHVLSSGLLVAGFALCAAARFLPVARFGALSAAGIAGALAADLWLVPALLGWARRAPATPGAGAGTAGSPPPAAPPAG